MYSTSERDEINNKAIRFKLDQPGFAAAAIACAAPGFDASRSFLSFSAYTVRMDVKFCSKISKRHQSVAMKNNSQF